MRPLPRYILAVMAVFVAFELWIPLLTIVIRALVGPTIPIAVQAVIPLFGLAVPAVVGLALSDYLADRQGLVRPYQPKRRPTDRNEGDGLDEAEEDDDTLGEEAEEAEGRELEDWGDGLEEQGGGLEEQDAGRAEDWGQEGRDQQEDRPARDQRQPAQDHPVDGNGEQYTGRRSRGPHRS